jgi:hypothetical protein
MNIIKFHKIRDFIELYLNYRVEIYFLSGHNLKIECHICFQQLGFNRKENLLK